MNIVDHAEAMAQDEAAWKQLRTGVLFSAQSSRGSRRPARYFLVIESLANGVKQVAELTASNRRRIATRLGWHAPIELDLTVHSLQTLCGITRLS